MPIDMPEGYEDRPSTAKPKVHRDRTEVTLKHLAVRTADGDVIQFPQANGYQLDDDDNLVITSDTAELARVALIRSGQWEEIYYPGAVRVYETFRPTFYDADGNEIDSDANGDGFNDAR